MQLLISIDQFGVEQNLKTYAKKSQSKSAFGGIMTLILYGASLGYFLYEFVDWAKNNKLPKITSLQNQIEQGELINLKGRFLEITSSQWKENLTDPFDPDSLILYPIIYEIQDNWSEMKEIECEMEKIKLDNGREIYNFFLKDKIIKGSPPTKGNQTNFQEYYVILVFCDQIKKNRGFTCANSQKIEEYMISRNYISFTFYITQFNSKTKQLYQMPKTQELSVSVDVLSFNQYHFQASILQINDGILFNNINEYKFISDYEFSNFAFDKNYTFDTLNLKSSILLYLTLDQIKQEVSIEYPNISEILASTGSIITWILQISFFVSKYNEKIFSQQTIKDIIRMYYPDIDELIIEKSFFGQILGASFKDKKYDPQKIQKILENLNQLAESKMNYINLQYEVSRIQLVLTEILGINYIRKHIFQESSLEKIFDQLKYNIIDSSSKSFFKINPLDQTNHPIRSQDSQDQEINFQPQKTPITSQDLLENFFGLLMQKQTEIKQNRNINTKEIIPNENCKLENIEND